MSRRRDRGMVTAELAVAIPVVVVVLALGLSAVRLGIDEIQCVDAARLAARALARGDSEAVARAAAASAAPPGAVVALAAGGTEVSATVSATRDLAGWRVLTVRGSASAAREETEP
ncbi:MAG TPA: TadE family type IV pilus minor pilin [Lapillicoccus sp.]|nr:TadE family type IV pilus minor pilin [Lapillicoccus sp.]